MGTSLAWWGPAWPGGALRGLTTAAGAIAAPPRPRLKAARKGRKNSVEWESVQTMQGRGSGAGRITAVQAASLNPGTRLGRQTTNAFLTQLKWGYKENVLTLMVQIALSLHCW